MAWFKRLFAREWEEIRWSVHSTWFAILPPFSLIHDFRKQKTRGKVSKISVVLSTHRIENHQSQPASMT